MRVWLGAVLSVLSGAGLAGCKDKAAAPKADPAAVQAAAQAEADLLARRDSLLKNRDELGEKKAALEKQITDARSSGGDTAELESQLRELHSQQSANRDEMIQLLTQTNERLTTELAALRTSSTGGGGGGASGAEMAQVVAQLQRRDAQLAEMEKRLATVVGALADIRGDIQKQAESCASSGGTTIVQAAPLPRGSKYSKSDIEKLLGKARASMQKRGILASDLPSQVSGLQKEATDSIGEGDFNAAYVAAKTLEQTVEAIRVDRGFIADKINRMSKRMKGKTLSGEAEQAFKDATDAYTNGKFDAANRKLNIIAQMM